MAYIECRRCDSPDCNGCNNYILSKMLHNGKFNCIMDEYHTVNPTADVAEVKHGEWILHDDGSGTCKVCGKHQKNIWDMDNWQNYCGHCGAKMDGGK